MFDKRRRKFITLLVGAAERHDQKILIRKIGWDFFPIGLVGSEQ